MNDNLQSKGNIPYNSDMQHVELLKKEQSIAGTTYSLVIFALLVSSYFFTAVVSYIAHKIYPDKTLQEALAMLSNYQLYRYFAFLSASIFLSAILLITIFLFKRKPVHFAIQKTKPIYYIISIPIALGLLFGLSWINTLFVHWIRYIPTDSLPRLDGVHFYIAIVVIALLPAVIEELLFRGIILTGLKLSGNLFACLVSGILFAIFHMNPAQTVYQFICGVLFAYIVLQSGSIFPAILMHFLNNFIALCDSKFHWISGENALVTPYSALHICIIMITFCMMIGGIIFLYLQGKKDKKMEKVDDKISKGKFFLYASVGIIGAIAMWIAVLINHLKH